MPTATVFTKTGSKSTKTVALPKEVFDLEVKNTTLLSQAYRAYLANGRSAAAKTLTRTHVSGGGRKPWRQKGTGRARVGSIRSPLWRGGGIVFGPTGEQNYQLKLPLKAKRLAIRQALSAQAKAGVVVVIESLEFKDGKTKEATELLKKLGANRRALLVVDSKTEPVERATRNLPDAETVSARYLNVFKVVNADQIIITQAALEQIEQWLGKAAKPSAKPAAKPAKEKQDE